jgi:hypothetical protein
VTARDVKKLLSVKHSGDLCVIECKNGPSYVSPGVLKIFDAWVLRRSWSHMETIGYEIKVNRSDFINDTKWPGYLPFCNSFYFVCPYGLISPEELPKEVGLCYVSSTGNRLYTKKKAPYREINNEDLNSIFRYVLICRTESAASEAHMHFFEKTRKEREKFYEDVLADRKEAHEFGTRVSKKLQDIINKRIYAVEHENNKLRRENDFYLELQEILRREGFSPDNMTSWQLRYSVIERLESLKKGFPKKFISLLTDLETMISSIKEEIKDE